MFIMESAKGFPKPKYIPLKRTTRQEKKRPRKNDARKSTPSNASGSLFMPEWWCVSNKV